MSLQTVVASSELIDLRKSWQIEGKRIAFVPTMGALHEGHLSLVKKASDLADKVIVSIFVNPTQFGPNEDFAKYPRTLQNDIDLLSKLGVDAVFAPNAADIYPSGYQTFISNESMANSLCGANRPGHFSGVLTVVNRLFHLVMPDVAVFGKKDYQQLKIIEAMVRDFGFDLKVEGGDIVRESDGLAMSSRNIRLSSEERAQAPQLFAALKKVETAFQAGERSQDKLIEDAAASIDTNVFSVDYIEIRGQDYLEKFEGHIDKSAVCFIAARIGDVRLIDNVELQLT